MRTIFIIVETQTGPEQFYRSGLICFGAAIT